MTIIGSFSGIFSSQSRSRKSTTIFSNVLKRQQLSTAHRQLPSTNFNKQEISKPEVITETSILNNFPRPNLMPTLQFALFGNAKKTYSSCTNCSGPHSTDFCPC